MILFFNWTARESDSGETKPLCARTGGLEDPGVTVAVASCERLHHPVNLLSFSRETEAPQKLPARRRRCKKNTHTMSSRKEGGGGFSTSSETQKKKTGLKVKTAAMFHTRMREYFGDTNLSACTRFRSENSCRPTKAFSICRCISSLPENNHTNQHIQDVYMLKQLPH